MGGTAPVFLAKFPVGILSGWLLEKYCPAERPRHATTMWLIVFIITMMSPILLTIFKRCLDPQETMEKSASVKDTDCTDKKDFSEDHSEDLEVCADDSISTGAGQGSITTTEAQNSLSLSMSHKGHDSASGA